MAPFIYSWFLHNWTPVFVFTFSFLCLLIETILPDRHLVDSRCIKRHLDLLIVNHVIALSTIHCVGQMTYYVIFWTMSWFLFYFRQWTEGGENKTIFGFFQNVSFFAKLICKVMVHTKINFCPKQLTQQSPLQYWFVDIKTRNLDMNDWPDAILN